MVRIILTMFIMLLLILLCACGLPTEENVIDGIAEDAATMIESINLCGEYASAFCDSMGEKVDSNEILYHCESCYRFVPLFDVIGFEEAVRDNLIDASFGMIDFGTSTSEIIGIINQFRLYWEEEMNSVIESLVEILRCDGVDILNKAQRSWLDYMDSNHSFRLTLFYDDFYSVEGSSMHRILVNYVRMEETRRRTLELMEYYFWITGNVTFIFQGLDR